MQAGLIESPEVNLYYTKRSAGPMLLILQGGAGNADGSEALADRFTVVTYDRRGLSRSKPLGAEGCELATHAADAGRLIAALSPEPAFVFGSSIGALIGLELAAHHSEHVRLLVAHEPPVYRLLNGAEQEEALRSHAELHETFQREGLPAAMKLMIARSGVDINDREPEVPAPLAPAMDPQSAAQRLADLHQFLAYDVPAVTRYQPDLGALTASRSKIVPAIGTGSRSTRPHRCAVAVAELLGVAAVEFPGGHTGYILRPKAFAAKLEELFSGRIFNRA
ncbi:MAG: alpha/beta hydrolase [Bryobacteraceae bacterium]